VISNCVINLSIDKPAVFAEAYRVLRPNGRLGVSDIDAENHLDATQRAERGGYVACIAGALSIGEYREGLVTAGFTGVTITPTQQVADGMHTAIRATISRNSAQAGPGDFQESGLRVLVDRHVPRLRIPRIRPHLPQRRRHPTVDLGVSLPGGLRITQLVRRHEDAHEEGVRLGVVDAERE
jgi:hypothetical protein